MSRGRMMLRLVMVGGLAASAAFSAIAQPPAGDSVSDVGQSLMQAPWFWPAVIFAAVVILVALIIMLTGRKVRLGPIDIFYYDTDVDTSKYESLMSEIQGLMLRNIGGENRDYYRKIAHLVRSFLDHLGMTNAREANEQAVREMIAQSPLNPEQVTQLLGIFDRCCKGLDADINRLDKTPSELLAELRSIVADVDKT